MLQQLKRTCLAAARRSGLSDVLAASEWRRNRLLIIGWHGVARGNEHEWDPALYVSANTFHRRLAALQRARCTVLPLAEAVESLRAGRLPERAVALTFDDGYVDFATVAWPALQAANYPATVYLTTKRCDHNRPIVPLTLRYLLWTHRDQHLDGTGLPGLSAQLFPLTTAAHRTAIHQRLEAGMRAAAMSPAEKDDVVKRVADRLGGDYDRLVAERTLTLMNPDEVSAAAAAGVDVQLHTHCHFLPSTTTAFRQDIEANQRRIRALTGREPRHFCYPSGEHRPWHIPVLSDAGIISATTCDRGLAGSQTDPLLLPRFIDGDRVSDGEFDAWLSGMATLLPGRPREHAAQPQDAMLAT